jgi:hypothetical protein
MRERMKVVEAKEKRPLKEIGFLSDYEGQFEGEILTALQGCRYGRVGQWRQRLFRGQAETFAALMSGGLGKKGIERMSRGRQSWGSIQKVHVGFIYYCF